MMTNHSQCWVEMDIESLSDERVEMLVQHRLQFLLILLYQRNHDCTHEAKVELKEKSFHSVQNPVDRRD